MNTLYLDEAKWDEDYRAECLRLETDPEHRAQWLAWCEHCKRIKEEEE